MGCFCRGAGERGLGMWCSVPGHSQLDLSGVFDDSEPGLASNALGGDERDPFD